MEVGCEFCPVEHFGCEYFVQHHWSLADLFILSLCNVNTCVLFQLSNIVGSPLKLSTALIKVKRALIQVLRNVCVYYRLLAGQAVIGGMQIFRASARMASVQTHRFNPFIPPDWWANSCLLLPQCVFIALIRDALWPACHIYYITADQPACLQSHAHPCSQAAKLKSSCFVVVFCIVGCDLKDVWKYKH